MESVLMKSNQRLLHSETLFHRNIENIFPVAGIGASAGGLDAFKTLLKSIPDNSGIAWVLVQHQHPTYESMLKELLQKVTSLPVIEITNNLLLRPNQIFVMPANKMLTVKAGKLKLSPRPKDKIEGNYPINLFFTSLAQAYESNAIGVVLSGTASDGTKGLQSIKEYGGITIAQSIISSAYAGMPESAIGAGMVDFILAPDKIPKKLMEIKTIIGIAPEKERLPEEDENSFKEILSLLHVRLNMDFTYYKQTTIRRRILRRMVINKYKKIADYTAYLKENNNEINALYQDMLIPVTSFFRDEKVFNNLCETVFPNLIKNKVADGIVRIWVAGCSTGEEAYSIAICFKEYLGHKNEKVQIFATDLSEPAIAKARAGIYTKSEAELVSHHRLKKFFTLHQGNYLVNKDLRDMCVFAVHNFLKDPPFVKLDFISCRNVLIYMDTYLQKKALTTFHYALNPQGLLMLGKSENTVGITDLFITNNKIEKIFTRKNVTPKIPFAITKHIQPDAATFKKSTMPEPIRTDFHKIADEMLVKYTPAAVVVNEALDIVHFRGNTSLYLETQGKPTNNLLKMAKTGLAFELRSILHNAIKEKKAVKKENIPVKIQNTQQLISLEAAPLSNMVEPHWLIVFNDGTKGKATATPAKDSKLNKKDEDTLRLQQLEQELAQLREDMRSITEEQETSNEELQSTNEELLSSNEELQSLNEELETSKEELQSTVEELTVVNQEMVNLNEQLAAEKEYAEAIIGTVPQPLLILNKDLRVVLANELFYKKFLVNEKETEGKLIYDIGNGQWNIKALKKLLEEILPDKKSFLGFEAEHDFEKIGNRIMRLNAREITKEKGEKLILLVIEDVTDYVQASRKIKESEYRYANMVYSSPSMITILHGKEMIITIANDSIIETWGKGKNVIGKSLFEVLPEIVEQGFKDLLLEVYNTGEPYKVSQTPIYIVRNGKMELNYYTLLYQPQKDGNGNIEGVAVIATDVTSEAALNEQIKHSDEKFKAAVAAVEGIVWTNNANGEMEGEQPAWAALTGQAYEEYQGYGWTKAVHPDDAQPTVDAWQEAVQNKSIFIFEHRLKVKDGTWRHFSIRAIPLINNDGTIREWVGVHTDITEMRKAEIELKEAGEQFSTLADNMENLAWTAHADGWIYWYNKRWLEYTGLSLEEMLGWGWQKVHHPDHVERITEISKKIWHINETFELTFPLRRHDGEYRWFLTRGYPITNEEGKIIRWIGTNTDITEQRRAEERFRMLADQSPMWVWLTDKEINVLYANTELLNFIGIKEASEFTGRVWEQKVHPEDVGLVYKAFEEAVNFEKSFALEFRIQNYSTLHYEWFYIKGVPRYEESEFTGFIGTGVNINEQKLILNQLEYRKALLEAHNESSVDGILLVDTKGNILSYNHRFIEIWNMPRQIVDDKDDEAALAFALTQLVNPQQFIKRVKWLYDHSNEVSVDELEFKDGKIIQRHGYSVPAPDGSSYAWSWVFRDITEQRTLYKAIQESEKKFRLLADTMPQFVWTADVEGNLNYFNQSVFNYSGLSLEQINKDGWLQIVHPDDREENINKWMDSISTGKDFNFEHRFKRYDGEYRWQLSRAVPQKDAEGNITMWVGSSTDIQKIKEEERRKGDFVKMVSHELKTPVTSIKGYVQLLLMMIKEEREKYPAQFDSSLTRIDSQVIRLSNLITEMLDLSRIETGKLELQMENFSINELTAEVVQDIRHTHPGHDLNLVNDYTANISGDRDRIGQVLINFINNAIKYSPGKDKVEISVKKDGEGFVSVSVKDYGIGISKEEHEKIFERFYRAVGDNENTYAGFGIGLFIANDIIKKHHGSITVKSEKDKGSEFSFHLPIVQ